MPEVSAVHSSDSVRVVLGLGSNRTLTLDDGTVLQPLKVLEKACAALERILSGLRVSSVYRTKAMYVTDQDDFYNMAASGWYTGTAEQLLDAVQAIEARYGRDRSKEFRNGPRSLDIDIEVFGDETHNTDRLQIPHPRLYERRFILEPMLEILEEPSDTRIRDQFALYLEQLPDQGVRFYGKCDYRSI